MIRWDRLFDNPDISVPYGFFAMVVLVVAISVTASAWRKIAISREEADLKRNMIDRGMSAEEIERVLRAKSPGK